MRNYFKRIKGFLLLEAMVFILVVVLSFVALHALHVKYMSQYNQMANMRVHLHALTNDCSPTSKGFANYCASNNIRVTKNSNMSFTVESNSEKYNIKFKDGRFVAESCN